MIYTSYCEEKNAFKNLINDNKEKSKTKHIYFTRLEIASYLFLSITCESA